MRTKPAGATAIPAPQVPYFPPSPARQHGVDTPGSAVVLIRVQLLLTHTCRCGEAWGNVWGMGGQCPELVPNRPASLPPSLPTPSLTPHFHPPPQFSPSLSRYLEGMSRCMIFSKRSFRAWFECVMSRVRWPGQLWYRTFMIWGKRGRGGMSIWEETG